MFFALLKLCFTTFAISVCLVMLTHQNPIMLLPVAFLAYRLASVNLSSAVRQVDDAFAAHHEARRARVWRPPGFDEEGKE